MPEVICTPHLGAATEEAQENVAVMVVQQVVDALHERAIKNAVNLPSLDPETSKVLRPWIVLAEKISSLPFVANTSTYVAMQSVKEIGMSTLEGS